MATRIRTAGSRFLFLFGLPFILAGLGVGIFYWGMLADWYRAQSWQRVPCVLERSELRDHMERRSGSSSSRDTLMNEAEAVYHYTYAGRDYTGHRVSLSLGADNFGDFHERVAQQMQDARNHAGGAFHCYVNPAHPHESVLFRQARWTLLLFTSLFPLLFPLVGALVTLSGWRAMGSRKKIHALQSRYPDEPWRWNPHQQGEWWPPENRPAPAALTAATVWMAAVWGPMLFALSVESDVRRENPVSLLGLLPALPLGLMFVLSLRSWARHARPVPQVHVQPLPVLTGGPLRVQVALPAAYLSPQSPRAALAQSELHAQLTCSRQWVDDSGEESTTRVEQLWTDSQNVPLSQAVREAQGSRVDVKFDLSAALPAHGLPRLGDVDPGSGLDWVWKLELSSPGWPQSWRYDMPVYAGSGSSYNNPAAAADADTTNNNTTATTTPQISNIKHTAEAAHRLLRLDADELEMHLRKHGMTLAKDAHGLPLSFDLPPARYAAVRPGMGITLGIMLLVFMLLVSLGVPGIPVFVFALFLFIIGSITLSLFKHGQLHLQPDSLAATWSLGPWRKSRQLQRQEILRFESKQNLAVGSHTYHEVRACLLNGKSVPVADGLPGRLVGEAMAAELERWRVRA